MTLTKLDHMKGTVQESRCGTTATPCSSIHSPHYCPLPAVPIERCFGSCPIAAADVCVSYSHAMTHSNGRADEAHLARALKLRTLSTVGAGCWVKRCFSCFILQFARLFAKVHANLVQPKSQIYVARYAPKPGVLSHPTLFSVRGNRRWERIAGALNTQ